MGKDTTSTGRIKKYGVCLNDKCENYKQIQEILRGDMECPVCKKKLSPCAPPKKKGGNGKLIGIIAAVVLVIAIAVLAFVFGGGSSSDNNGVENSIDTIVQTEPDQESIAADTVFVQVTDTIRDTVTVENNITTIIDSPQTEVEAKNEESKPEPKAEAQPKATGSGTIRLTYGTYTGDIKNGYPEGQGRLVYSTTRVINKYDQKERQAKAGEYVMGEFQHGYFIQGKHYGSDGTLIQTLMIGVPASLGYENK